MSDLAETRVIKDQPVDTIPDRSRLAAFIMELRDLVNRYDLGIMQLSITEELGHTDEYPYPVVNARIIQLPRGYIGSISDNLKNVAE